MFILTAQGERRPRGAKPRAEAHDNRPGGSVTVTDEPAMNSDSRRSWWWRLSEEIALHVIDRREGAPFRRPQNDEVCLCRDDRKTTGHAQDGARAGLRTIGQARFFVRAAGHGSWHRSHSHICHRPVAHSCRRLENRSGQNAYDREDRKQAGEKGPELHTATMPHRAAPEKIIVFSDFKLSRWLNASARCRIRPRR
jgi:hypothetical protein